MKALRKDIFRTIAKEKKRLIALAVIAALGVTMMTGLKAACDDVRHSAGVFFYNQKLHDINVISTLGLTEEDVAAIEALDTVESVEGCFSESVKLKTENEKISALIKSFSPDGMDIPYCISGQLPVKANEIAVTETFLQESHKKIGDTLTLIENNPTSDNADDDAEDSLLSQLSADTNTDPSGLNRSDFIITGIVIDVTELINPSGTTAYRNGGAETNIGFVTKEAVKADYYTNLHVCIKGAADLDPFSQAYKNHIASAKKEIEEKIVNQQEKSRIDKIRKTAEDRLSVAESEMYSSFAEAESKLASAKQELDTHWAEIESAEAALSIQAAEGEEQLAEAKEIIDGNASLFNKTTIAIAELLGMGDYIREATKALDEAYAALNAESANAAQQIAAAKAELANAKIALQQGEAEYQAGLVQYQREKENAQAQLAQARKEMEEALPECKWYLQDRNNLNGFTAVASDAGCIESIGTIFPIIFLLVALLISLTTITRMVEENRGLIGTYLGLGYTKKEIRKKYLVYTAIAGLTGGILGNLLGYVVLPIILFSIFKTMYLIPEFLLSFNPIMGLSGILLFVLTIMGAALWACHQTLNQKPAELMRPKPPASGSRILLERIKPLWTKMSFFRRVTARNLFRYKKRMFMTIFGIAGCTALLVTGLSIKDTVAALQPSQYEKIIHYDIMTVSAGGSDNDTMIEALLPHSHKIRQQLNLKIDSVEVADNSGNTMHVQLYVIPDGADCNPFLSLYDINDEPITLKDDVFYLTRNIGTILDCSEGDTVTVQDSTLKESESKIGPLLQYYLGNMVVMTQKCYEDHFDHYEPNALLINLKNQDDSKAITKMLNSRDEVLSLNETADLKENFSQSFAMMNMVFYIVIVLAAALAFSVLFTLATTNISERERELATIKVLGFYDREVHHYINKEVMILTLMGIVAGLPMGVGISLLIEKALKLPSIVYDVVIQPISYVYAAGIALIFTLIVNWMAGKVMNKIDAVGALKGVE